MKHKPRQHPAGNAAALTAATSWPWETLDGALLRRLDLFCREHPDTDIVHGTGYWQGVVRADGLVLVTRYSLDALLGRAGADAAAVEPGPGCRKVPPRPSRARLFHTCQGDDARCG